MAHHPSRIALLVAGLWSLVVRTLARRGGLEYVLKVGGWFVHPHPSIDYEVFENFVNDVFLNTKK